VTDLGLSLIIAPAEWLRILLGLVACAATALPFAYSIDLIARDASGSAWQSFKQRVVQLWTVDPWNQVCVCARANSDGDSLE
jgi:hypothetical protein